MKKIAILFSIMIVSISAVAQVITTSKITLSSASQGNKELRIAVASQFSDAYDNGYDAVVGAGQAGGLYIVYGTDKYTKWATNALADNLPIGFGTVDDDNYTLSFSNFSGASFTIYDRVADQTIIVDDATPNYYFSIDAADRNKEINNRFFINYDASSLISVTLNAYGLATFSNVSAVSLPSGLKAYSAKYVSLNEYLLLTEIFNIPENTGVFLYGEANATYLLPIISSIAPLSDNDLLPASAWTGAAENVYVLSGNEMHEYTGDVMKENKAYLQLPSATPAPRRIALQINETQGVNNVETTVKAEKFMKDGQIFIRRGEEVYNLQGQIVK